MVQLGRRDWILSAILVVVAAAGIHYGLAWRRGDDIYLPGGRIVRRFPCSSYALQSGYSGTTQAFAVIDGAALAAESNTPEAVTALVEAVFDRELPTVRCGNPLRRRVAEAEWRFRRQAAPPLAEHTFVDAANQVLTDAAAPAWARTNVEEIHFLRTALRPELSRFIGTVGRDLELSDEMSPAEAAFVAMTLGTGMLSDPNEFRGGPDTYLQRLRVRQQEPRASGRVVSSAGSGRLNLSRDFDAADTMLAQSVQRFLDRLSFPP